MRKLALITLFGILMACPLMAEEMQSIFSGHITSGGYGGPIVKIGEIDGETAVWIGGKGGWVINHGLVIGGAGYGLVSEVHEVEIDSTRSRRLACGYGGLMLEYIYEPYKIVHMNAGVLIGAGGVGHLYNDDDDDDYWHETNGDAFFALEPSLGIELNIARHIRCELGASYLYTSGAELSDLEDKDLRGVSGYASLKFGAF